MLSSSRVAVACVSLVVLVAGACSQDDTTVTAGPSGASASETPDSSEAGPAAVVAAPSEGDEIAAGTLEVGAGCVILDERGHYRWIIAWPGSAIESISDDGALSVVSTTGAVELRNSDRVTLTGHRVEDPESLDWIIAPAAECHGDGVFHVSAVTEALTPGSEPPAVDGPIGGGLASGTGSALELACLEGIDEDSTEWFGPATLTQRGAVAEAFGDLIVGWIGEPYELESAETWSSWGLDDEDGNLVAVATVVASNGGWDPSHARYCVIPQPTPPPPPFTLYVSNQSFEDPTVAITISIDDVVVVDENFDVEGQHNWISFEPDIPPGEHVLHAVSDTGAEFTSDFTIPEGEPRWAVIDYWFYPDEGPRNFTFSISDEPIAFG